MTTTEFKRLMTRHMLGIATPEEEQVLQQALSSDAELGRIAREFCDRTDLVSKYKAHESIDRDAAFDRFQKIVGQDTFVNKKLVSRNRWWNRAPLRVAAALVPLILLTTAIYYIYDKQNEVQILAETPPYTSTAPTVDNPLLQSEEEDTRFSGFEPVDNERASARTVSTPRAATKVVALDDGTRIHLNSCSSIIYPEHFDGNTREVSLKGEAYFEIAADAQRPFIVHTATADVRQYGTRFNVNAYDEGSIKVTLAKGSVGVTAKGRNEKRLTPGQSALIAGSRVDVFADNVERATEWMQGLHHFERASTTSIHTTLQRMFAKNTIVTDAPGKYLTGCISTSDNLTDISDAVNTITDEMPIESDLTPSDSQHRRVTLSLTNADGPTFLSQLHKQTGISYLYHSDEIGKLTNIVVKAKNEPVETVLKKVFTNTKYQYRFRGNVLTIKYNEYAQTTPPVLPAKKTNHVQP